MTSATKGRQSRAGPRGLGGVGHALSREVVKVGTIEKVSKDLEVREWAMWMSGKVQSGRGKGLGKGPGVEGAGSEGPGDRWQVMAGSYSR